MKLRFLLILSTAFTCSVFAQTPITYDAVDKVAGQIPEAQTHSVQSIAGYINARFKSPADKSRAIFYWLTQHVIYDVDNMYTVSMYRDKQELIDQVLKAKKGVCAHYAELYNAIAEKSGLKSMVVTGYTRQAGIAGYMPHAWCAVELNSTWYWVDPTWGTGGIRNGKFVKQLNNLYFKIKPEALLKSHMPFDPLFQFSNRPITNQEFDEGKVKSSATADFNFPDSLAVYEKQSEMERLIASTHRIERNGARNPVIYNVLQYNKYNIEVYYRQQLADKYNTAVNHFNEGIQDLNLFVNYRNQQFTPKKPDSEIIQMLARADSAFAKTKLLLSEIKTKDANILSSIAQLNQSLRSTEQPLLEQHQFLDKYMSTSKLFRKTLFYKYTYMGIPLN